MFFQAFKVIWSLLLLNVGLCQAMRRIIPAPPNETGIRIASVSCRGNLYTKLAVHNAIKNRLHAMDEQGQRDMVVFTSKGKLVKVIAQVRDESLRASVEAKQW
ncbi:hypothetical protein EPUL_006395, partial [Erysiphe pulchra]